MFQEVSLLVWNGHCICHFDCNCHKKGSKGLCLWSSRYQVFGNSLVGSVIAVLSDTCVMWDFFMGILSSKVATLSGNLLKMCMHIQKCTDFVHFFPVFPFCSTHDFGMMPFTFSLTTLCRMEGNHVVSRLECSHIMSMKPLCENFTGYPVRKKSKKNTLLALEQIHFVGVFGYRQRDFMINSLWYWQRGFMQRGFNKICATATLPDLTQKVPKKIFGRKWALSPAVCLSVLVLK